MLRLTASGCLRVSQSTTAVSQSTTAVSQSTTAFQRLLSSEAFNHEKHREFFAQYKGGSVDLVKNEKTGLATVILNHPEKKNSMTGKMFCDFSDVISELESWSTGRGVLLHGSNNTFCSGGDHTFIREFLHPTKCELMSRFCKDVLNRLFQLPLVSLALVEGRALGGGAEVACACDFRAFSTSATLGFVQTKLAVSPGWGGGARLVQLLGRTKALKLLASGALVTSEEAQAIGLADIVVPDGAVAIDEALTFLQTMTVGGSQGTQAAKKVVVNASAFALKQAALGEEEIFKSVWASQKHVEILKSNKKFVK